jgi:ubiquinone/menaquinone biosynthesis C-methylase UbiE
MGVEMDSHINQRHPDGKPTKAIPDNSYHDTNKIDLRNEIQEEYRSDAVAWPVWVFSSLHLPENSHVLEIGCGTGEFWQENATHLPESWKTFISDYALNLVQKAKTNLSSIHRGTSFFNLDGLALPFRKASVDAVLAIGLLDLVPDLTQVLSEAWRVLKPSGQLIATAGGPGHLKELEDLLRPYLPPGVVETLGGNEERFGLENGEEVLARFFVNVSRHNYSDQLVFTELEPILDYVLSEQAIAWSIPLSHLGDFVQRIKHSLSQNGKITVTVRKGLFVARKKVIRE